MLRPKKRLVGVTVGIERDEIIEDADETVLTESESSEVSDIALSYERSGDSDENLISLDIEEFIEENESTFGATVEVEGRTKHKASVIRQLFNENEDGASVDRLRRVRSYTKYLSPSESEESVHGEDSEIELDEMMMVGDTVCGKVMLQSGKACFAIGKIASMRDIPSKKFKTVSPVSEIANLQFQVNICHARVTGDKVQLTQSSSGLITWKGTHCVLLQMNDMEMKMEKAIEFIESLPVADNQQIELSCLPYHPALEVSIEPGAFSDKIPCRICGEGIAKKLMRKHVGEHIIKDEIGMVCGFCGMEGCSIDLVRGSGRGKTATLVPGGNCEYRSKFSIKSAEKTTKTGPCTNRPVTCDVCETIQWSYNLPKHYRVKHSDYPIPSMVTQEEKKLMGLGK